MSSAAAARVSGPVRAAKTVKTAKTMSIGTVLKRLQVEFPEVTVSKIRFLETEGLVSPARTASGYRRFTDEDVDRLRYVLTLQRDKFLPLKVIREQLTAIDAGTVTPLSQLPAERLNDREVAERAGVDADIVAAALRSGFIAPDRAGYFSTDDVTVVRSLAALSSFGFDARAIAMLKNSASRQADLIRRVTPAPQGSTDSADQQRREQHHHEVAALVMTLISAVMKNELAA